jgi:2-polyprenyl-3-methyl-5-hydroxy-6-metoxy-1,4-benzoquinol methylase
MYAKENYHDLHYKDTEISEYSDSAALLKKNLSVGSKVLDYGCGTGEYLKALTKEGLIPFGVEFDENAAKFAAIQANCKTLSVNQFLALDVKPTFDAIHLGDVLVHLPDPMVTLKSLLGYLHPTGILFVEGPLERNPSPVYWAILFFGSVKKILRPRFMARHTPTHLFQTDAKQQLIFFKRTETKLDLLYWQVYETGWPYASGGVIKLAISGFAKLIGGKRMFGVIFGNRFRGIFKVG